MTEEHVMSLGYVRVKRTKALETIKENAAKHKADFEEAVEGYKVKLVEHFERCIVATQSTIGTKEVLPTFKRMPEAPLSHLEEYEKHISMLEWATSENIDMNQQEFEQLIMDKWHWKEKFAHTNAFYASAGKKR